MNYGIEKIREERQKYENGESEPSALVPDLMRRLLALPPEQQATELAAIGAWASAALDGLGAQHGTGCPYCEGPPHPEADWQKRCIGWLSLRYGGGPRLQESIQDVARLSHRLGVLMALRFPRWHRAVLVLEYDPKSEVERILYEHAEDLLETLREDARACFGQEDEYFDPYLTRGLLEELFAPPGEE